MWASSSVFSGSSHHYLYSSIKNPKVTWILWNLFCISKAETLRCPRFTESRKRTWLWLLLPLDVRASKPDCPDHFSRGSWKKIYLSSLMHRKLYPPIARIAGGGGGVVVGRINYKLSLRLIWTPLSLRTTPSSSRTTSGRTALPLPHSDRGGGAGREPRSREETPPSPPARTPPGEAPAPSLPARVGGMLGRVPPGTGGAPPPASRAAGLGWHPRLRAGTAPGREGGG